MPSRLRGWDYGGAGAYFITICTYRRQPLFGEIAAEHVLHTALGAMVQHTLDKIVLEHAGLQMHASVVMPDHVHAVFEHVVPSKSGLAIDLIVRKFKGQVSHHAYGTELVTRQQSLWQRGFFDRVIRSEQEFEALVRYVETNPLRSAIRMRKP
jgi:putative transposase